MTQYLVMQGNFKANGSGDMWIDSTFTSYHEAIKRFNAIKKDAKDLASHYSNGFLRTEIQALRYEVDEEPDILRSFEYQY